MWAKASQTVCFNRRNLYHTLPDSGGPVQRKGLKKAIWSCCEVHAAHTWAVHVGEGLDVRAEPERQHLV